MIRRWEKQLWKAAEGVEYKERVQRWTRCLLGGLSLASSKEKQNTSKMEDAVFQNGGRIMFQMCSRAEKTRGVLYYKNEVPVSSHLVYTRRNELDTVHWTQSIYMKKC